MLTIATANVNGIRAAYRRGTQSWLDTRAPDVLLLQEVRATDDVLRSHLGDEWQIAHNEPTRAGHRGRAGVAVVSRLPITDERDARDIPEFDDLGRWVEADIRLADGSTLTAVSVYVHTGEAGTPKQDQKHAFLDAVTDRLTAMAASGRHVLVCGDLNVCHTERDLKNWKPNRTKAGFLPSERAYLDRWRDDLAYVDVQRQISGDVDGPYSWWSWRGKAFDNDAGWRIDYQLATPELASAARTCEVDRAPTYADRWSDHAPVVATYDLG